MIFVRGLLLVIACTLVIDRYDYYINTLLVQINDVFTQNTEFCKFIAISLRISVGYSSQPLIIGFYLLFII